MRIQTSIFMCIALVISPSVCDAQSDKPTFEFMGKINHMGSDYFGLPLGFDGKKIALLGPAGQLRFIPAKSKDELVIVAKEFRPYTPQQVRQLLYKEFGDRYDLSTTDRFIVTHPWGSPHSYAQPFETLHDRFVSLVESHGVELESPKTPLVAIVLRSRNDFDRYLINEVQIKDSNVNGYYSSITNRITTYDPSGYLRGSNDKWIYDAGPIIHEAVHQSAFNTGLHNRFASPPKWMSEGLATLFEAKGISDQRKYRKRSDRINTYRLKHLRKKIAEGDLYALLLNLIDNDRIFETDIETAYSLSWGLSFYLYESDPQKYFQFLAADAKRKNFTAYTRSQRLRCFAQAYGNDFEKLTKTLTKFYLSDQN